MLLLVAFLPVSCRRDDAGEASKQVVIYCAADQDVAEPILADFEKQTGIKVLARYDTEAAKTVGLAHRLRTEAGHPVADVFWSGEVFHTARLAREGLFEPRAAPAKPSWPAGMADAEGRWHGFALRARVICYHTGRVKAEDAPRRIEDLLDPQWKGRLVMAAPEAGTASSHMAALFVIYGRDGAERILKGLRANGLRLVDGNAPAVRMVATGQADVGLTDTDDVYSGLRNGWPIAMNCCRHGDGGALVFPHTIAQVRGAPHPAAAQALLAYLADAKIERRLAASDIHTTPVDAAVAQEFPAYAIPSRLAIDYDKVAEALPDAIATASKILR